MEVHRAFDWKVFLVFFAHVNHDLMISRIDLMDLNLDLVEMLTSRGISKPNPMECLLLGDKHLGGSLFLWEGIVRLACQMLGGVSMSSLALGRGFHVDDFLPWYPIVCLDGCLGWGIFFCYIFLLSVQVPRP